MAPLMVRSPLIVFNLGLVLMLCWNSSSSWSPLRSNLLYLHRKPVWPILVRGFVHRDIDWIKLWYTNVESSHHFTFYSFDVINKVLTGYARAIFMSFEGVFYTWQYLWSWIKKIQPQRLIWPLLSLNRAESISWKITVVQRQKNEKKEDNNN